MVPARRCFAAFIGNGTIISMRPDASSKPRIGLPYRTRREELAGEFTKVEPYMLALRAAGAEPVVLSLGLSTDHLEKIAETLDGVLLTGSPADVEPSKFKAVRHAATSDPDAHRERTDWALLEHCFTECKPLLAICYGIQSLNVFLEGTLVQDIATELETSLAHEPRDEAAEPEVFHTAAIALGSKLSRMPGAADEVRVNSSHHQSILELGRDLKVVARAPDGVVEAIEWTGDSNWVLGVQWHPERMAADTLAQSLFRELVQAARKVPADV
jgi:putative glutamine amidotransferase